MKHTELQIPQNILPVGNIQDTDVRVYIHQDVYKSIEYFSAYDISKECGSVLLGDYTEKEDGLHIIISDFIEARYTDSTASSLTFTHDTWDFINLRREKLFPEKRILGWQHTHPGYGIFLSAYDMFIQENFFDLPFQVAYVTDPVKNERGFFRWKDKTVQPLNGFFIYDDSKKPVSLPKIKTKKQNTVGIPKWLLYFFGSLLLLTTVISVFSLLLLLL